MVNFILGLEPLQNLDGFFRRWLVHLHLGETTFQGRVFFNVFLVFTQGRCPDDLDFTPRQSWLEDVGCINGPFRAAGPNQGMELINEENDLAVSHDFFHNALHALFELTPVLGPSHQAPHIQHHEAFLGNIGWHVA